MLLEWGGAEPFPRASFLRREKGGATEDPVLCVSVCVSPFGSPKHKIETLRFPSFWNSKSWIARFEYQIAKKVEFCKKGKNEISAISAPKSLKNDKVFHYESMPNDDSSKMQNSSSVSQFPGFRKSQSKYLIKPMENWWQFGQKVKMASKTIKKRQGFSLWIDAEWRLFENAKFQ